MVPVWQKEARESTLASACTALRAKIVLVCHCSAVGVVVVKAALLLHLQWTGRTSRVLVTCSSALLLQQQRNHNSNSSAAPAAAAC